MKKLGLVLLFAAVLLLGCVQTTPSPTPQGTTPPTLSGGVSPTPGASAAADDSLMQEFPSDSNMSDLEQELLK